MRQFSQINELIDALSEQRVVDTLLRASWCLRDSRVVEMLLGKGIFVGQGAEALGSNSRRRRKVSEARAGQPGERAVFAEELAGISA